MSVFQARASARKGHMPGLNPAIPVFGQADPHKRKGRAPDRFPEGVRRSGAGGALSLLLLLSLGAGEVVAGEQPIKRTELLRADIEGMPQKESIIYVADVAPGAAGGKHIHHGDEFVYILAGSLVVEPVGKAPVTLGQGEVAHLSSDIVHAARNGSHEQAARVLVFLVVEKGKPLAEPR